MKHQHFILYKPYGYLSQFVNQQNKRKNKKLLGELIPNVDDLMSIGRLDEKSEGLLLLTTDGKFSEYIRSSKIEKEYHVMVDGNISEDAIHQLQHGIEISVEGKPYVTKPCNAQKLLETSHIVNRFVRDERHGEISWLSITISEGKFRQVRKMTAKAGFPTLRLVRVRIGKYVLNGLNPSEYKEISSQESYE
jgi:23S rRNA pseudouridine2457 synthase